MLELIGCMLQSRSSLNRGQSGIELIILVGFFAFFFLVFLLVIHQNTNDKRWENRNFFTQEIALQIQQEIALASESSSGYSRQFDLPLKISGVDYSADILEGNVIYVYTADGLHALSLPVANVTGSVVIGSNLIKNIDGSVYLNFP